MPLITLMTDFGLRDGYTGVMKGVIYRIAPNAQIADITHLIHPQNVREGSLVWKRSYRYFPQGTVHIGVVDPGVGTQRRPIAARVGDYFFVCPDNGLITSTLEEAEQSGETVEIVHLDQPRFWLAQVSNVFHGRDIFAPAGAHLASGVDLLSLGTPIHDPQRAPVPAPEMIDNGWRGQVIHIDHFGNLAANIKRAHLEGMGALQVLVGGQEIHGLSKTFGDGQPGQIIALIDSSNRLSISIVNGDAAQTLSVRPGDAVEVISLTEP